MRSYGSIVCVLFFAAITAAPSAQKGHASDVITELPMPELYLQPVKYVAHTGSVSVPVRISQEGCVDANGNPLSPCMVVPYTYDYGPWTSLDLSQVVLPGRTLKQALGFVPRFGPSFSLFNNTLMQRVGKFQARLAVTLESPALPGGAVQSSFGDRIVEMTLAPSHRFRDQITYTRDGIVGRQWLRDNFSLSERDVDAFFDNEIGIRMVLHVRGALMDWANIYAGVMIQGY